MLDQDEMAAIGDGQEDFVAFRTSILLFGAGILVEVNVCLFAFCRMLVEFGTLVGPVSIVVQLLKEKKRNYDDDEQDPDYPLVRSAPPSHGRISPKYNLGLVRLRRVREKE